MIQDSDKRFITVLRDGPGTTTELARELRVKPCVIREKATRLVELGVLVCRNFNELRIDKEEFIPETLWELADYEVAA